MVEVWSEAQIADHVEIGLILVKAVEAFFQGLKTSWRSWIWRFLHFFFVGRGKKGAPSIHPLNGAPSILVLKQLTERYSAWIWSTTYVPQSGDGASCGIMLIPGSGRVSQDVIGSIQRSNVCLKGGPRAPATVGVSSPNVRLRDKLGLMDCLGEGEHQHLGSLNCRR
jgi:hypothetical protein